MQEVVVLSEVLRKVKEFCKRVGGRTIEFGAGPEYRGVSCILPRRARLSLSNSSGLITLASEEEPSIFEEIDIGDATFEASVEDAHLERGRLEVFKSGYDAFILGDFRRIEAAYDSRGRRVRITFVG